jgi:hypothetical protein
MSIRIPSRFSVLMDKSDEGKILLQNILGRYLTIRKAGMKQRVNLQLAVRMWVGQERHAETSRGMTVVRT